MKLTNLFIRDFFSYKRPHASLTEQEWIERFILPKLGKDWWQDDAGNIHYDSRINVDTAGISRTLFVAHTDTVHHHAGRQKVSVGKDNVVRVVDGECLGADDGAGTLVLLAMIEAKVPAYYIFTRCEERGGIGAKHLRDNHPALLAQFDRAIAFDRRGTSSVITHQGWGRCCSDEFADALSDALTNDELMFAPDDTGVYTDTAEFVGIIPECTNISVGYLNEHRETESLDLTHLQALIDCAILLDWDSLPVMRDVTADEGDTFVRDEWGYYATGNYMHEDLTGLTDYNNAVFDACQEALNGEMDMLLYVIAEAVNPADPDEVYERIWNMPVPEHLIKNAIRQVDYATDDEQTARAMVDLYQAVIFDNVYQ